MTRVGLLFPGEMGALVAAAARADVLWASEGRSQATALRAETAGLRDTGTLAALAQGSEVVLSICPPAIAEEVARAVAEAGFRGIYVEGNAISPARAEGIADGLAPAGIRMVDGAIIAGTALNLYLSGSVEEVERVAELFQGSAVSAIPLEGGVGAASALKMAFGGWNKIGVALVAQAYAIAREYGVEEALAAEGVESDRLPTAGRKAWRWVGEMEEVAATCERLDLPGELARGAAQLYERWAIHRDEVVPVEQLLDELGQVPGVRAAREP